MTLRPLPTPLYGVTLDNCSGAGKAKIANQLAALQGLPHQPTVRIVFDPNTTPADYAKAINAYEPHAYLMGLLIDSSSMKAATFTQSQSKTKAFLAAFPTLDVWEVGNEVNGNWTGPYASVAVKVIDTHDQVKAAGGRTAITLYENSWAPDHCGDGAAELTPVDWSAKYLPATVRAEVDYVFLSWYPTQCTGLGNLDVPVAAITAEAEALHALYPNALVGFGEVGLPRRVASATLSQAQQIADYYYGLKIPLAYWCGGGFWWNFSHDAVPWPGLMGQTLAAAMQ